MDGRIERIWLKSCEMRGVSPEDIRSRKRDMVAARHDTWILCADLGISYKRIVRQRYNHRKAEWHFFIDAVRMLPYAEELILVGLEDEMRIHDAWMEDYLTEKI